MRSKAELWIFAGLVSFIVYSTVWETASIVGSNIGSYLVSPIFLVGIMFSLTLPALGVNELYKWKHRVKIQDYSIA